MNALDNSRRRLDLVGSMSADARVRLVDMKLTSTAIAL